MKTKQVTIDGKELKLIRYKKVWVFPLVTTYQEGLGSPIAILLQSYHNGGLEYYSDVTVNLDSERSAGCQFIDTNNNGDQILDWLEENKFGERTGRTGKSGFCTYPEFNFYKGETFREYKKFCNENFTG